MHVSLRLKEIRNEKIKGMNPKIKSKLKKWSSINYNVPRINSSDFYVL